MLPIIGKTNLKTNQKTVDKKQYKFYNRSCKIKNDNNYEYFKSPKVALPNIYIPDNLKLTVLNNLKKICVEKETASECYLNLLKKVKNNDELILKENNYLNIFTLMLYLEEIQHRLNMTKYNQYKTILKVATHIIKLPINVNNLIKNGLLIRIDDTIKLIDLQTNKYFYIKVTDIEENAIWARCNRKAWIALENKLYKIMFCFQNYTFKCCHYALKLIKSYKLIPHIFPSKRNIHNKQIKNQHWFNTRIENNPEQKQAVLNIVCKSAFPAPYLLYGPPGTGKTSTLVEAICQIWYANPSEHILVCTSSNIAADVITKKLLKYIPKNNMCRMYSPSKEGFVNDMDIAECSNYLEGQVIMLPKEIMILKNIIICTLCASIRLIFLQFRETHFSYIFIDEAGQVTEPESMIPFGLLSSNKIGRIGYLHGQVVIAGDPQQLGPIVCSKLAEPILGKSILSRLMDSKPYKRTKQNQYNSNYITKLIRNYRSHPMIIHVSNKLFYEEELLACGDESIKIAEDWKYLTQPKFPIIFHGVKGTEIKHLDSKSPYNREEIEMVLYYVELLIGQQLKEKIVTQNDIGIITPFTEQKRKIDNALQKKKLNDIDVGTVEIFQGQEKNIIIISTVRSEIFCHDNQNHLGFLSNSKRLNVALTRARALLIIIGNPKPLMTEKHWCFFLDFCKSNNACRGVSCDSNNL